MKDYEKFKDAHIADDVLPALTVDEFEVFQEDVDSRFKMVRRDMNDKLDEVDKKFNKTDEHIIKGFTDLKQEMRYMEESFNNRLKNYRIRFWLIIGPLIFVLLAFLYSQFILSEASTTNAKTLERLIEATKGAVVNNHKRLERLEK